MGQHSSVHFKKKFNNLSGTCGIMVIQDLAVVYREFTGGIRINKGLSLLSI